MRIYLLKALAGDCFLLDFNNGSCVLIDGGYKTTYTKQLKQLLINLKNEGKYLEYVILTHYDSDHIGGLLALLEENEKREARKLYLLKILFVTVLIVFVIKIIIQRYFRTFIKMIV